MSLVGMDVMESVYSGDQGPCQHRYYCWYRPEACELMRGNVTARKHWPIRPTLGKPEVNFRQVDRQSPPMEYNQSRRLSGSSCLSSAIKIRNDNTDNRGMTCCHSWTFLLEAWSIITYKFAHIVCMVEGNKAFGSDCFCVYSVLPATTQCVNQSFLQWLEFIEKKRIAATTYMYGNGPNCNLWLF